MQEEKTIKLYNDIIYAGVAILAIILGFVLQKWSQWVTSGIAIYFILTLLFFDNISRERECSLAVHGKMSASLFMIAAILIGMLTRNTRIFLLFIIMPEIMMLFYIKARLYAFLRKITFILFSIVWLAQIFIWDLSATYHMESILTILVHIVVQYILENFIQTVEFQRRENREQEMSLDDLLKVIMAKKDEADRAAKAKTDFLSNMSHEIRTPINAILGMNEMIARESREKNVLEYSDNILGAGKMLLSIINDILDFSKIESGRMDIIPVEYQVSSLINDLVNLFYQKVIEKKLAFHLETDGNIPSALFGDEVRIRQIITNLVSNAVKYTDAGSVTLSVGYEKHGEEEVLLCVKVIDTGRGIKQEDIGNLFQMFQRVDQKNNRNIEGTGLGLAITQRFVTMLDGEITVESEYGKGSVFGVKIPQKIINHEPMGDYAKQFEKMSYQHERRFQEKFIAPEAKVLVVDDNTMNLAVVEGLLKETQVQVVSVSSGVACLDAMRKNTFDVVLLDHMMPGMDGVETLKQLRQEELAVGTPILALTANAVSGAREMYFDYGFSDYLSKPISGSKLEKAIFKWLPDEKIQRIEPLQPETPKFKKKEDRKDGSFEFAEIVEEKVQVELPAFIDEPTALMYSISGTEGVICNMKLYLGNVKEMRKNLQTAYENEEYAEYGVYAHALKSTSKTIGAVKLSELALAMEEAGGRKDGNYIKVHHEQMLQMYEELVRQIEQCVGTVTESSDASVETDNVEETYVSKKGLKALFGQLYEAAEAFDSMELDDLIEQLGNVHLEGEELIRLRKAAKKANEECEYLELSDIAQKMLASLEGEEE